MNALFTRHRAEAWRAANPTPAPAPLARFVNRQPRVLPVAPRVLRAPARFHRRAETAFLLALALLLLVLAALKH